MTMTAPTTDCTILPTVPDNEMPSFGNSQEPRSPPRIPKIAFPIRPDPPSPTSAPAIPPIKALTSKEMTNCIISIRQSPFLEPCSIYQICLIFAEDKQRNAGNGYYVLCRIKSDIFYM